MYCKICGATLSPGDVFCKNCGASNTNANVQPVAPAVEPVPVAPVSEVPPVAQPVEMVSPVQPEMAQPVQPQPIPVEPVQPRPVQPVFQGQPAFPTPQPTFTQPVQNSTPTLEPKHYNTEKGSGKGLLVIGVIVGLLATAVIAYLIYSSLTEKNNNDNNGGTTVVTQSNYSVNHDGYRFTMSSDYVAYVTEEGLQISTGSWTSIITSPGPRYRYNLVTEAGIRNALASVSGITIEGLFQRTYSGVNYWRADAYAAQDASRASYLFVQRSDGSYWFAVIATPTYSKVPDTAINQLLEVLKNSKQTTTSNIEEGKDVMNIPELNLGVEETEPEATE